MICLPAATWLQAPTFLQGTNAKHNLCLIEQRFQQQDDCCSSQPSSKTWSAAAAQYLFYSTSSLNFFHDDGAASLQLMSHIAHAELDSLANEAFPVLMRFKKVDAKLMFLALLLLLLLLLLLAGQP
jgi:hypothetical protein